MKPACPLSALLAIFFGVGILHSADDSRVRAWQDSIQLPTYEEGEADQNPQFAIYAAEVANYPYPLRNNFTKTRSNQTWRTLNIENEYLLCRILPDLGGHLYSCRDKRSGHEVFYANPVVKKGPVGIRGAWVAMGIESNFPVGHSRDTVSPVDFALRSHPDGSHPDGLHPDGSASAIVESTDHGSRMQWRVEYVLRPGSTVLEMRVVLYNRSAVRQPYYWWANAGVAFDDPATRFVLPSHMVATHGRTEIEPWPVSLAGRDESLPAGRKDGAGWFSYGSREPFFAVYKPNSRSGVAHFADPAEVPGKKLWLWGVDGDAYVRGDLTDNFPSYIEIQGGLMENQETFDFLGPQQSKSFSEYWIPIHDMSGVSRVGKDATVSLQRRPGASNAQSLELEISVSHAIKNASIRLMNQARPVFEARADLDPAATYRHVLESADAPAYAVQLADSRGSILLEHTEGVYNALASDQVKLGKQSQTNWSGPEETESFLLARGSHNELNQLWRSADSGYTAGLRKFPNSVPLQKAKARLALGLNRFEEAAGLLARLQAAAPADEETAYLLGVSQAMLGHDAEARQMLSQVPPASPFAGAAAFQLALTSARARDFPAALATLKPLLDAQPDVVRAGAMEVASLRHAGRKQDASSRLAFWRGVDPADTMLRFESTQLGASDEELWPHLGADAERVLDLVDEYVAAGLYDDALVLLTRSYPNIAPERIEPGAVVPRMSPLVAYYRFFCRKASGAGDPSEDLRLAAGMPMRYAFPYRPSSFRVLKTALAADPSNPATHFLLGRLYLNSMMTDQAIAEWRAAISASGHFPELYRDLGRALAELKKDPAGSVLVLREGLKANPASAELRAALGGASNTVTIPGTSTNPPPASSPAEMATAALLAAASGRDAIGMFTPQVFSAEKQADDVRRAYIEVKLQRLMSQTRSQPCPAVLSALEKLGEEDGGLAFTLYGFDKYMKEAHFQYYMGIIEQSCQADKDARKRWTKISKMSAPLSSPEYVFPLLAASRINPAEAKPKLEAALESVRSALSKADAESKSTLIYAEAMLLRALGQNQPAAQRLQEVLKTAASVTLQYLAGVELRQISNASN